MRQSHDEQKKKKKSMMMLVNNILTQEIGSWSNFEFALREGNRHLFHNMLYECKENKDLIRAANSRWIFLSRITVYGIDITAAKDHKRIDY